MNCGPVCCGLSSLEQTSRPENKSACAHRGTRTVLRQPGGAPNPGPQSPPSTPPVRSHRAHVENQAGVLQPALHPA
jgi:hypothetical protein